MNDEPLAMNATQLKSKLGISASSLYRLVKAGKLTPLSLFKRNRLFAYAQILELLNLKKK
jgi:predicted site-specific integrase-resolvase